MKDSNNKDLSSSNEWVSELKSVYYPILITVCFLSSVTYLHGYWYKFNINPFEHISLSSILLYALTNISFYVAFCALLPIYLLINFPKYTSKSNSTSKAIVTTVGVTFSAWGLVILLFTTFYKGIGIHQSLLFFVIIISCIFLLPFLTILIFNFSTRTKNRALIILASAFSLLMSYALGASKAEKVLLKEEYNLLESRGQNNTSYNHYILLGKLGDIYYAARPSKGIDWPVTILKPDEFKYYLIIKTKTYNSQVKNDASL